MRRFTLRQIIIAAAGILICLLAAGPALAGAPAVRVVVSDADGGAEIVTTDPALLGFFAFADLSNCLPEAPVPLTPGYLVVRYWDNGPFDRFHYYPSSGASSGYVYYDGFLQGWSGSDGCWYTAEPAADKALKEVLHQHNLPVGPIYSSRTYWLAGGVVVLALSLAFFTRLPFVARRRAK